MTPDRRGPVDGLPSQPDAAADYWAAKHELGTQTARESAAFEVWLEDPANAAAYARTQRVLQVAGEVGADTAILNLRAQALNATGPARWAPRWRTAAMLLAAILALASIGWFSLDRDDVQSPAAGRQAFASAPAAKRYETRTGEQRQVRLDDGSRVWLNTASVLEVAYTARQRDVRLLRGQALFEVAHNKTWPFVVTAGDRQVTAVGTAFDVRIDGPRVKVVLVEGRVKIEPLKREGLERLLPQLATEQLTAGQQLTTQDGVEALAISAADVERTVSWRNGEVIFRDDRLAVAVAELNRYSVTQILVTDPRIANLAVSGVFRTGRPDNFVAAVTTMFPIDARQTAPGVIELRWRDHS